MNEGESTSFAVFLSLDGILVSVINSAYKEVALFGICSTPSIWEVEVNGRWKVLDMALAAWLEDQWQNQKLKASLQEQIEVRDIKRSSFIKHNCTNYMYYHLCLKKCRFKGTF